MIDKVLKEECCGCAACANACPHGTIEMREDVEGFMYPRIDMVKCLSCNLCEKACPALNPVVEKPVPQKALLLQHRNEAVRRESTSGGAFTALAEYVLELGGLVFGAALTEGLIVRHVAAETEEDLSRFRNSKYVQSEIGYSFTQAKHDLVQGRWVLFSGTPCQIEGLLHYLGRPYERLLTVDVVCRAVPSPMVYRRYIERMAQKLHGPITTIRFRDKTLYGYTYPQMFLRNSVGKKYFFGTESDPMHRAFFSGMCNRPSCYSCRYKKRYRLSDFTLWDCQCPALYRRDMDDDIGTTSMLIHTAKGREVFASIRNKVVSFEVEPDRLAADSMEMVHPTARNPKREVFLNDAANLPAGLLFTRYFPDTLSVKVKRRAKIALYRLGIYNTLKVCLRMLKGPKTPRSDG